MSRSRVLRTLFLVGVSLAVTVLAVEVVLRIGGWVPTESLVTVTESEFSAVPGIFAPNQDLVDRYKPAIPYHVHIDSLGYRGGDFPRQKSRGEFRLLTVGDSFTFGSFVDDDKAFPARLEVDLKRDCPNLRVINAGIGGTTIVDQLEMTRRALPLEPDFVLLTFSENDVTDLSQASMWSKLADNRRVKSRFPLSILYPALRRTALWNLAVVAKATFDARATQARTTPTPRPSAPARQDRVTADLRARYRQGLLELQDLLQQRHIGFAMAIGPSHVTVLGERSDEQLQWIEGLAGESGIPIFNPLEALRAAHLPIEKLYLLPEDGHPSPTGHQVMADDFAVRLQAAALFSEACRP